MAAFYCITKLYCKEWRHFVIDFPILRLGQIAEKREELRADPTLKDCAMLPIEVDF